MCLFTQTNNARVSCYLYETRSTSTTTTTGKKHHHHKGAAAAAKAAKAAQANNGTAAAQTNQAQAQTKVQKLKQFLESQGKNKSVVRISRSCPDHRALVLMS